LTAWMRLCAVAPAEAGDLRAGDVRLEILFELLLEGLFKSADVRVMARPHHHEKTPEIRVLDRGKRLVDLAYHPSLSAVEQLELVPETFDGSHLVDEVAGFVGGVAAQTSNLRGGFARIVAFIVANLLEQFTQLGALRQGNQFIQHASACAFG